MMASYEIRFTREAVKDISKLSPRLKKKLKDIVMNLVSEEPYLGKKLLGDLKGFYSLRLSYRDRIVYSVDEENKTAFVHRARTHSGQ